MSGWAFLELHEAPLGLLSLHGDDLGGFEKAELAHGRKKLKVGSFVLGNYHRKLSAWGCEPFRRVYEFLVAKKQSLPGHCPLNGSGRRGFAARRGKERRIADYQVGGAGWTEAPDVCAVKTDFLPIGGTIGIGGGGSHGCWVYVNAANIQLPGSICQH